MPHTHHAAFAQKRGAKNTKNVKNTRKSAEKRNPFEYQGSHKNYGSNHEFNSRRERNRKAEKARQKAREKALRYEEVAIADAEQDFAKHNNAKNNVAKNNIAKNNIAKSNNEKQNSAISLRATSKKQKQDSHNATIIPDSAIESRENYRDDVTFAQLGVPEPLVEVLRADGKTTAFPIQQATLPDSLQGANILGRGRTGSGKTLAFSIPLVARLAENFVDLINSGKNRKSRESSDIPAPRAIILAPTRELVHQIDDVIAPLAAAYGMRTVTVYGGVRYQRQVSQLKQGAQIVLACPGRLEDLLRQGALTLEKVMVSVLDEADEMADMGFLPAVTRLLEQVAPDGQRMLFSATLDKQVSTLVERFLPNAVVHAVDDADCQVDTMTHHILLCQQGISTKFCESLLPERNVLYSLRARNIKRKIWRKNLCSKVFLQSICKVICRRISEIVIWLCSLKAWCVC